MQGALLGSFLLHGLLLYAIALPGSAPQTTVVQASPVLQIQLVPEATTNPEPPVPPVISIEEPTTQLNERSSPSAETPKSAVAAATPNQETTRSAVPWRPQEPKVEKMPELAFPPDTVNITAMLEIEVQLDKDGTAQDVKILRESPKAMFTEWAWEMGMKGQYSPKITASGPVPSKLTIRIDITPGMPLEVR